MAYQIESTSVLASSIILAILLGGARVSSGADLTLHILNPLGGGALENVAGRGAPDGSEQQQQQSLGQGYQQQTGGNQQQQTQQQQTQQQQTQQQQDPGPVYTLQHKVHQQMPQPLQQQLPPQQNYGIIQQQQQQQINQQQVNLEKQREVNYVVHQEHKPEPYQPPLDIPQLQKDGSQYQQQLEFQKQNQEQQLIYHNKQQQQQPPNAQQQYPPQQPQQQYQTNSQVPQQPFENKPDVARQQYQQETDVQQPSYQQQSNSQQQYEEQSNSQQPYQEQQVVAQQQPYQQNQQQPYEQQPVAQETSPQQPYQQQNPVPQQQYPQPQQPYQQQPYQQQSENIAESLPVEPTRPVHNSYPPQPPKETAHLPPKQLPIRPVPYRPNKPIDMFHTPTEAIKCDHPLADGSPYYEDNMDCNCYYVCGKQTKAIKMCCPSGLWWDQKSTKCLYGREFQLRKQALCLQLTRRKAFALARIHAKEVLLKGTDADKGLDVKEDNTIITDAEEQIDLTLDRYYSHLPDEFIFGHCSIQPNPAHEDLQDFIWGSVDFRQSLKGGPTELRINASGFNPADNNRLHGFHVHEYGDLSQGCESAGGHYDPFGVVHGGPRDSPQFRHFGDLGNIEEDSEGNVETDIKDYLVSLLGPFSVLGRAAVIHMGQDDLGRGNSENSLLTGSAGSRLACCTIGLSDGARWT